jgi:hypothetical protein
MRGSTPPLPYMSSWSGVELSTETTLTYLVRQNSHRMTLTLLSYNKMNVNVTSAS